MQDQEFLQIHIDHHPAAVLHVVLCIKHGIVRGVPDERHSCARRTSDQSCAARLAVGLVGLADPSPSEFPIHETPVRLRDLDTAHRRWPVAAIQQRFPNPGPVHSQVVRRLGNRQPAPPALPRLDLTRFHTASMSLSRAPAQAGHLAPGCQFRTAPSVLHHAPRWTRRHLALPRCAPHDQSSDALHVRATRPSAFLLVRPFAPNQCPLRPLLTSRSGSPPSPFQARGEIPQVRTHSSAAEPSNLRRFALIKRASRPLARSHCSAAPPIRFLSISSQLMLHASFPRSIALAQLRFTSFAVINLRWDLHPQECAHIGRTK